MISAAPGPAKRFPGRSGAFAGRPFDVREHGVGEVAAEDDVCTALRWAADRCPGRPLFLAGDSSGGHPAAAAARPRTRNSAHPVVRSGTFGGRRAQFRTSLYGTFLG